MSYTAPNRLLMPMRHSIDTLFNGWNLPYVQPSTYYPWPSANLALYVPIGIPIRVVVRKLWFASGDTGTGNVDMALYDSAGVAVVTATAAAKGATATEQVFDVTDTTVGPGLYYLGMSSDSGTDTYNAWPPSAPFALATGILSEAAAYPLPSTATWTEDQSQLLVPVMGLLIEATVA